jgi:hypothetical protein
MMVDALVAPSARDMTRTFLLTQLAIRGINFGWTSTVPATRPQRFGTIQELNATDMEFIADSQLLQLHFYDIDASRCASTARLGKALWKVMPTELEVQSVEIAGGPTEQADPDVPGLARYLVTGWVTVMTQPA